MSHIRQKAISGLKIGDSFTIKRTFAEEDMIAFAGITRDYNPIHFDERFAAVKKFNGRICHGLLVAGMLTEAVSYTHLRAHETLTPISYAVF